MWNENNKRFGVILLLKIAILTELSLAAKNESANTPNESKIISFDLSPTAELSVPSEANRRRLSNDKDWNYRHGIYGALEHFGDEWKEEFDATRYSSRFERQLQAENKQKRRFLTSKTNHRQTQINEEPNPNLAAPNNNPYQLSPLFQGYGTHYSTVWVGSPPQRKSVIVDTGSHYTAFPCVGCTNCGEEHHTDPYFDPNKSSTFRPLDCNECEATTCKSNGRCVFSQSYTEGSSWSAYQVVDRFFCGSSDRPDDPIDNSFAIDFMFGCQTSETGLFVTQLADGIMGMSAHPATLPNKMYEEKKIPHNMFTLCFKQELSVSKEGVLAGVLTLGGVDTRLNSSPMVYAQNKAESGWYTVNVKNIFLRKGGGSSALLDSLGNDQNSDIIHLPMNPKSINSGKGVIVDSGTTDTYLSKTLQTSFYAVWNALTGMNYSNSAVKLTREQILKLPTLLIQLEAYDGMGNKELMSMEQQSGTSIVGLVGNLDVTSPRDVLIAVPAANFFEYSPSRDTYTSRLYFTESRGGVLGANAMQGHDVLFDWENGRIGFAESSCDYGEISQSLQNRADPQQLFVNDGQPPSILADVKLTSKLDCALSQPTVSQSCASSVGNAIEKCNGIDPETVLEGVFQTSFMIVENVGSGKGKNCQVVAQEMVQGNGEVTCSGTEICTLIQPCQLRCRDILEQTSSQMTSFAMSKCDDDPWGECTPDCSQSRMRSQLMEDGSCGPGAIENRPCHIDACGSHNPCSVPFVVHVGIGLDGVEPKLWSNKYEDIFVEVFANIMKDSVKINPGDIDVLMTTAWDREKESDSMPSSNDSGIKLILEISILRELKESESSTECLQEEILPFARQAFDLETKLKDKSFVPLLLSTLKSTQAGKPSNPFELINSPSALHNSKIISSWTIKTDQGSVFQHSIRRKKMAIYGFNGDISTLAMLLMFVFTLCGLGWFSARKLKTKRDQDNLDGATFHSRSLTSKLRKRYRNDPNAKYSKLGFSDGDIDLA